MISPTDKIVLIGFKNVGKTSVGKQLAQKLQCRFIDLDRVVEQVYQQQFGQALTYRQIMTKQGEAFFQQLEHQVLRQTLSAVEGEGRVAHDGCVLALGGRTPLTAINQQLLTETAGCVVIYLQAAADQVFDRLMAQGRPAFFPMDEEPRQVFTRIWQQRTPIYQQVADFAIDNSDTVERCVAQILTKLCPPQDES